MRNGPKTEKMGQSMNSTRPGLPHTGSPHGLSILQAQTRPEVIAHGRVPTEPRLSPIRKKPLLRAHRHSKAYKYTIEEEKRGVRNYSKEAN
ncbi:Voltage-dependent T-type calcium channel subunit alpha-1G [Gossypium arboreum]|uniref:Voltage-dependent T-type calcium channel subunit alpha-1G n=1 Tax=Gossypium arboreum TaxID=29729 RepID=A0A0B0MFH3_GOSAR|nr:Voltage-dependent T-type calcium channel subunit alpha-1G [Gossypium arboreum]